MFGHLNPVDFQKFGTIKSEKPRTIDSIDPKILHLRSENSHVYCSNEALTICCRSAAILSVSEDNITFTDFYLDKYLTLKPNIYFRLIPLNGEARATVDPGSTLQTFSCSEKFDINITKPALQIGGIYTFFYHEKEPGFVFIGESHSMLELTYIDNGSLHSLIDGKDFFLQQGDMMLYAPDQFHMQYADTDVAPCYISLSFVASGRDLSCLFNRKFSASQKAVALLQQMLQENEHPNEYSADIIISLLSQLLLTLLYNTNNTQEKIQSPLSIANENQMIRYAQQYISQHIRDRLSVPIVSKGINISPSYLTALFHKHLQISPGEYIRRVKLQESKRMIRENSMSFTEIASALNYSTVHHFSRQFKEKFGITPSEYAKSVR